MALSFHLSHGGGINGLYQIIGEILKPLRKKIRGLLHINGESLGYKIVACMGTFVLIDFSWIFFRANRFMDAFEIIRLMGTKNPWVLFDGSLYNCGLDDKNFRFMVFSICILAISDIVKMKDVKIREIVMRQDSWAKCIFVSLVIAFILLFGKYGPSYNSANFIYFQF